MHVDIDKRRKITRGIFQKIFGSSIKYENVSIFEGFSVGTLFLENGPNDFSETLHDVRYQKVKKSDTAGFFEKKPSRRKIGKNRWKSRFKKKQKKTALTILIKSCMKIEEIDTEQHKKPHIKIFTGSPENHEKPVKI